MREDLERDHREEADAAAGAAGLDSGRLQAFLDDLVAAGELTAVTALSGTSGGVAWTGAAGHSRPGVPAGPGTVYDYGSLTKPFVATLALVLDAAGRLPLSLPVGEVFPRALRRLARRPLADLLRHRAGVAAWAPLYARCETFPGVLDLLLGAELPPSRPGTYSDLDFLLWGFAAERVLGRPLFVLLAESVLAPLGLTSVVPFPGDRPEVAEHRMGTGMEVWLAQQAGMEIPDLGPPLPGRPQDGNSRFLNGLIEGPGPGITAAPALGKPAAPGHLAVSSPGLAALPGASTAPATPAAPTWGHAGLFGNTGDLFRLGQEWLRPGRLLKPEAVAAALAGGGPFALGWWRRSRQEGGGGAALSPGSFGHTGFPGGNVWIDPRPRISWIDPRPRIKGIDPRPRSEWIDPRQGLVVVLLGHRLHPLVNFNPRRRAFNTLVYDAWGRRSRRPPHPDSTPERRRLS